MPPGSQIGSYRILSLLGEGGMGSVWLAEHTMLGRKAAIKVLHPMYSNHPEVVARFFNEARAATAISDPGIVQIFDFGRDAGGNAYIVMELLEGETLEARLSRIGAMPIGDALRVMRQIATSLGAAHARGIIHRDLKPENIFLVRDSEVLGGERTKIVDFGIAKLVGDKSLKTRTAVVMGTPMYMSPEQCRDSGHVDQRADVYALGCLLFKLIAGQPPFDGDGAGEVIAKHLREPPPLLSSCVASVPRELDALVARCLAKELEARYASAGELAAAIGGLLEMPFARRELVSTTSPPPSRSAAKTTTLSAAASTMTSSAHRSRRRLLAGTGGILAIGLVGGMVAFALCQPAPTPTPTAPPTAPTPAPTPPAPTATAGPVAPAPAPLARPSDEPELEADQQAVLASRMKDVLRSFVAWSRRNENRGKPCPTLEALGAAAPDPWGHPLVLTCVNQPPDQMIGATSVGPDGKMRTGDDVTSWSLGSAVADLVRGPRWAEDKTPAAAAVGVKPARNKTLPADKPEKSVSHIPNDSDGIPDRR